MKPKHHKTKFVATREFTDRVGAVELFIAAVKQTPTSEKCEVLNWYGVGGEGKSALLGKIISTIDEMNKDIHSDHDIRVARVNLDIPEFRSIEQALLSVRLQLGLSFGASFPCFDTGFARYHVKTNPQVDIRSKFPELFKGENTLLNDTIELVKDLMEDTPGIGFLYKYSARLSARLKEWYKRRGSAVLSGIDTLEADKLLAKLPEYLGADLFDIVEKQPNKRIFIGLDTYEALWRDTNTTDPLMGARHDEWVRTLVAYSPGVLYAIFGRDKLQWEALDADWASSIDCHRLGALSDEDSHLFLSKVPIKDIELCNCIVQSANGLPFYLDLQVQLYERLMESDGIDIALFGGTHADILQRFLDHLPTNEHTMVRLASYPNSLSENILMLLFKEHGGGINNLNWNWFTRQSFISKDVSGAYAMHALMRENLQALEFKERLKVFQAIHVSLFNHFDETIGKPLVSELTKEHDILMLNALYHRLRYESDTFFDWLEGRLDIFRKGMRASLLEQASLFIVEYGTNNSHFGNFEHILKYCSEYYNQRSSQGFMKEAEHGFRSMVDTYSQHEEHGELGIITIVLRNNLAIQIGGQGRHKEAENEFRTILKIIRQHEYFGERNSALINVRFNLAYQLSGQSRHKEAAEEYLAVWELRRQPDVLGEMHLETLVARQHWALQIGKQGLHHEAEKELRRILEIVRSPEVLGEHHHYTLSIRNNLAIQIIEQGDPEKAEIEFRAVLNMRKNADILGDDYIESLRTRYWLAKALHKLGDIDERDEILTGLEEKMLAHIVEKHNWIVDLRALEDEITSQ
jgi:tetratricopeptide (TPR) repeat protein